VRKLALIVASTALVVTGTLIWSAAPAEAGECLKVDPLTQQCIIWVEDRPGEKPVDRPPTTTRPIGDNGSGHKQQCLDDTLSR
jgi:hypothetical protein